MSNKVVWWVLGAGIAYVAWQAYQTYRLFGGFPAVGHATTQANGTAGAAVTGPNTASAGL